MKNFGRSGGFSGPRRDDFRGGRPNFGERKELFDAVCSNCGKPCKVPFRPNGTKPVFCKDCFVRPEEGSERNFDRRDAPRSFDRPRRDDRPSFTPPVKVLGDPRIDTLKRDVESLTVKIDTLIGMLQKDALHTAIVKATAPKARKVAAPVKAKKTSKKK